MINKGEYHLLDIATGTGELAFEINNYAVKKGKRVSITGMDFSNEMLSVAKEKAQRRDIGIRFEHGDAMKLHYKNNSFDVVTSAFALRNVDNLNRFASEARRVLKTNGKFVFMDMAKPDTAIDRFFLKSFWTVVGGIGLLENRDAYDWLMYSVDRFDKQGFVKILQKTGFKNIHIQNVFTGAAFMVTGNK